MGIDLYFFKSSFLGIVLHANVYELTTKPFLFLKYSFFHLFESRISPKAQVS